MCILYYQWSDNHLIYLNITHNHSPIDFFKYKIIISEKYAKNMFQN